MSARQARAIAVVLVAGAWLAFVAAHAFTIPANRFDLLDREFDRIPFALEAMLRTAHALFGCVLAYLAAWQVGRALTGGRQSGWLSGTGERVHVTLAVGVAALSGLLFTLAAAGAYRPAVVAMVVVAAAVSRPSEVRVAVAAVVSAVRSGRWIGSGVNRVYSGVAAAALGCALVAALAPETEYDALWYHLWLPTRWLAAGRPVDVVHEFVSLYPLGWELLNGAALVLGGPVGAKLLHFVCLPLTASAAVQLAREIAPRSSRHLVFALTVTAPTLMWEASTAYVDLALAWLVAVATLAIVRHGVTGDRRWQAVAGVVFGAALSVKHLGLAALAIALGMLLVLPTAGRPTLRSRAASAALVAVIAVAIASPWYVRAWVASRNPFFPELTSVFGAQPAERWSAETEHELERFKQHFGRGRTGDAMLRLPWDTTTHPAAFGGAFGPLFLMLAPLALLARDRRRLMAAALACAAYVAVWASPLGSLQLRFLVPVVPLLAIIATAGADGVMREMERLRPGLSLVPTAVLSALLVLLLPPFTAWHERDRRGDDGWLTHVLRGLPVAVVLGGESEDDYLARIVPSYRAWRFIDTHTASGSRVLTFEGGDHLYSYRDRLSSEAVSALPATWHALAGDEAAAMKALLRLDVSHVLLSRRQLANDQVRRLALVSEEMRACCLQPVYEDNLATVFQVVTRAGLPPPSAISRR